MTTPQDNPLPESLVATLQKVLALAERGAPGECDAARAMLNKLLAKYQLTLADIQDQATSWCHFPYKNKGELDLLMSLYWLVTDTGETTVRERKISKTIQFQLTKVQKAEMDLLFSHYVVPFRRELRALEKELRLAKKSFFPAFLHKQHLLRRTRPESEKRRTLSQEETEAIIRLMRRMEPIAPPRRQLAHQTA